MMQEKNNYKSDINTINDQESYFSFIFSPFKKSKNKNRSNQKKILSSCPTSYNVEPSLKDMDSKTAVFMQENRRNQAPNSRLKAENFTQEQLGKEGVDARDVDGEAEVFIREKRKKLMFSKTMSLFRRK